MIQEHINKLKALKQELADIEIKYKDHPDRGLCYSVPWDELYCKRAEIEKALRELFNQL